MRFELECKREYWTRVKDDMQGDNEIEEKILFVLDNAKRDLKKDQVLIFGIQKINREILGIIGEREFTGWIEKYGIKLSLHYIFSFLPNGRNKTKRLERLKFERERIEKSLNANNKEKKEALLNHILVLYLDVPLFNTKFPFFGKLLQKVRNNDPDFDDTLDKIKKEIPDFIVFIMNNCDLKSNNINKKFIEEFIIELAQGIMNKSERNKVFERIKEIEKTKMLAQI